MAAQQTSKEASIGMQAVIITLTSFACQLLRRKPLNELLGELNVRWVKQLCLGGLIGSALKLVPELILGISGWVKWQINEIGLATLSSSLLLFAGVAVTEELLFRGSIFQRLISGLGQRTALLITGAFFVLTHLNNPGVKGSIKLMAGVNIFLASILFGLAFIRTRALAMPLGLHWMANWMQGRVLGFGVSGTEQVGLLKPIFGDAPAWLTDGPFRLEASAPGLICLLTILIILYEWKLSRRNMDSVVKS